MEGRLAVFIGQITQEYQTDMLCSIVRTAREYAYAVDVFSEFGSYGDNFLHAEGERNIIHLPTLEDYSAVILAPDTFGVKDMEEQLDIQLLARVRVPVVSIRKEKDCFYSILIDNRAAMESMVEHLIRDHHLKRISFMKGREDLKDANERFQGYKDAMTKHGLPITDRMLFLGNYWRDKGAEAVDWFLGGEEMPEAIVCANDFMGISVLTELISRGYRVPEDIVVTGFDDVEEASCLEPALSSVEMPCEDMGRAAVELIHRLRKGEKAERVIHLPVKIHSKASCGCRTQVRFAITQKLYLQKKYLLDVLIQNSFMNVDYENCDTMEELFASAYQFSAAIPYDNIYICMCQRVDEDGNPVQNQQQYTRKMQLRAILHHNRGLEIVDESFDRVELLPARYREEIGVLYLFPLHHKNRCLGYVALQMERPEELREFFRCWVNELCSCMDKVLLWEENLSLKEFRRLSIVDELTGLYNRRRMEQELSKRLGSLQVRNNLVHFFLVSLDMDGLKKINDTYGHLEGDAALVSYGHILQSVVGDRGVCCRVGGDEFSILLDVISEEETKTILHEIDVAIDRFNRESGKPYLIGGSMGYAEFQGDEELTSALKRADVNMYANKAARKKNRK